MAGTVLDVPFPRRCGLCGLLSPVAICEDCRADMVRAAPHPAMLGGALNAAYQVYEYRGRAAQAVKRLKYGRVTSLAEPMSDSLVQFAQSLAATPDLIVPVPIHWTRRFYRGFNQADLLAERFPRELVQARTLRRTRRTRSQARLSPAARLTNLVGAFTASQRVQGMSVLLIDDVHTTGHTGEQCARALKDAGAKEVRLLAFAGEHD